MSIVPAFVSRTGHGAKASTVAGAKASAAGQDDQFAQALGGKPKQAGGVGHPQPGPNRTAEEIGPPPAGKASDVTIARLAALLNAPLDAPAPADRNVGPRAINTIPMAGMTIPDQPAQGGVEMASQQEETEIEIPHVGAALERRLLHGRTLDAGATTQRREMTDDPEVGFPDPVPAKAETESSEDAERRAIAPVLIQPELVARTADKRVVRSEPEGGVVATGKADPDLRTAVGRRRTDPALADTEAHKPVNKDEGAAPDVATGDRPRGPAVAERAAPSQSRPITQEHTPQQRAETRPQPPADDRPASQATVDTLREERALTSPNIVQAVEPLAGRVTVLPTAVAPAATLPTSPTAAAFVTSFAAEANPPQMLREAALAVHTVKPGAPVTLQTLKIQLQPAELGLVTARLTVDGEKIAVDLHVETAEARHKMAAESDQIVQALRGMGFDIDRVTVQQSQTAGGAGAETRSQSQQGGLASQDNQGGDAGERRSSGMDRGRDNEAARDRQGPGNGGDAARGGSLYI